MANSFETDIDALDEATLWEMLRDFTPENVVTLYFERDSGTLVAGLTDEVQWEQAATELAVKVAEVSNRHIARWLNWAEAVHATQSSALDRGVDVDDILDQDEL